MGKFWLKKQENKNMFAMETSDCLDQELSNHIVAR